MTDFQHLKSEIQNWNLYTDEKLISKLDSFINNMMAQCEIITKNTQQTLYEAQAVSIYLSDTFNALSNLSNKQFVENSMAPVEEPQIVPPKKLDQSKQVTAEKKQENFQQALKNVIGAFSIADNDDDETLSKSNTMPAMFRTVDHLPYITGSKAFNEDEFLGIIDRNESLHNDALANGSNHSAVMIEQQSNNDYSEQNLSNMVKANEGMRVEFPVTRFPPGISNRVPINNMLLGSPPPLQQLFKQYEQEAAAKPYRNIVKIVQEEQKIETSNAQPQKTFQQELNEKLGGEMSCQSSRQTQFIGIQEIRPSARNVLDILSDPMYQRVQPRPQIRQNQLFNEDGEDDDEEIGNKNMFRDSNAKKNNFRNLLNPVANIGNSLLNPFNNANPFDPFGLQNPFMPFNPKPAQDQVAVKREETKEQLETDSPANISMPQEHGRRLLKFLNEDSGEDEETRLQNRLLEWQKPSFTQGLRLMNKTSDEEEKPVAKGRVSKLFRDEEGIPCLQSNEPEKPKTKIINYEENNFLQNPASRPKKDGTTRRNRPSLFSDDDDVRVAKPEPKTQRRTRLFSDSE